MPTNENGRSIPWRHIAGALLVSLAIGALYRHWLDHHLVADYHGNYSGFLQLGRERFDDNPLVKDRADIRSTLILLDNAGYDGQFAYYMAFDPWLRKLDSYRRVVDYPPYRYGRIGYSLLTKLFSGDRWRQYPKTMVMLLLAGLVATSALLGGLAFEHRVTPALGLLVAIVPGFWESLQVGLPEPIAAAFLIAGLWALTRGSAVLAGLAFAVAVLVRETSVVFVVIAVAWQLTEGKRALSLRTFAVALIPVIAWRAYVAWSQFPMYGYEAIFVSPKDFGLPFRGIIEAWQDVARGQYFSGDPIVARAAEWYPLLLIVGLALAIVLTLRSPSIGSVAAVAYGIMAVCLNNEGIWGGIGGAIRDTFEIFVGLALATMNWPRFGRSMRIAVLAFWGATAAFVLLLSVDAPAIRAAFLPFGG